ncbi:uncharacterized protein tamo [Halyomorpha halys]|uniref:uncharacterized protein tamo n=1 Tax=Halyomorpha halys TaxID=286706 RepID=UPI0006D4F935|nr:uncharacterized protein LOC106679651 [Halyomorpha halys]XP_014274410.1 uncharacterized protein LOC106679651 [Halyomorpha halys]XP_014274411.1 uncharacterized protein LOC106679651 [Halyomorpha halys]
MKLFHMADNLNPGDFLDLMMVNIDKLHYNYLSAHESLRKLDEKNHLEGHIKDYLMVAPHEKKFCYRETSHILHKSAEAKENFSGYGASAAWTAIAAYAHNLLAQSWRKEFREIKVYSGYFKHNIESGLTGAELMLTLMGYRPTGDEGTYILEGPVDPDRVVSVSRDSLVALVECQILCSLKTDLIKSGFDCSWLEILEYRELQPCTLEQALHGLMFQYSQRYLNPCRPDCYSKSHNVLERHGYNHPHYRYPNNLQLPYFGNVSNGIPPSSHSCSVNNSMSKCATCQKDFSVSPSLRQNYSCSVPTAQLIELESSYLGKDNYIYDNDNQRNIDKFDGRICNSSLNDSNSNLLKYKSKDPGWDSWGGGTSYHSPENKIKNHKYEYSIDKRQRTNEEFIKNEELEEALKAFSMEDSQPSCSTADLKLSENKIIRKKSKHEFNSTLQNSTQTLGRENIKKHDINYMSLKVKLNDKWECSACTFHNSNEKEVCEICSKSKTLGNEVQPLISGGRQCPKCTLVNEKGVTLCDACGTNLKDSPTYI